MNICILLSSLGDVTVQGIRPPKPITESENLGRYRAKITDKSQGDIEHQNIRSNTSYNKLPRYKHKVSSSKMHVIRKLSSTRDHSPDVAFCGQRKRQELLKTTCKTVSKNSFVEGRNMVLVDDVNKVIYCEVPKVACTSWKVYLANLTGTMKPEHNYSVLHELIHNTEFYPQVGFRYLIELNQSEQQYRLKHYFKFMVVRNPFARLISAYENKLAFDTDQSRFYQENVGTHIVRKFRKNPSKKSLKLGNDVTFNEFLRFLLEDNELVHRYDPHWWLYQGTCLPCRYGYDYIAKLETLDRDLDFLMDKIGSGKPNKLKFPHFNVHKGKTDQLKITKYYKNVPKHLVNGLLSLYDIDTKMFGYKMNDNAAECHP